MSAEVAATKPARSASAGLVLRLSYDRCISYAFQQNAIPVITELVLQNDPTPRSDLVVRITTEPAFAAPTELRLQTLEAGAEYRIAPVELKLSHDFLADLTEKVAGWIKVEVSAGGGVISTCTEPVTLFTRNEWCGLVTLPEILAAFVLPNDPAIMIILGRAAQLLQQHTGRAALNGYQDKSRKRAWEQLAAIYRAIVELGLRYITPPASFENSGQKVRFPTDIIARRFATCLDLSLLVAACCEQAGLHPLVLMHEGHAYAGCWLEERTQPDACDDDLQQLRKLAAESLVTVFESTLLASESPGTLRDAELLAAPHLETSLPYRLTLDVRRARLAHIHPLPMSGAARAIDVPGSSAKSAPAGGLGDREFAPSLPDAVAASTPATRIDHWKSRLLDLSLRNRLLNFKETKSTIRILSGAPEQVEDELAAERELSLQPKPRLMVAGDPRDPGTYARQQHVDALAQHLRDELAHGRLHTGLDEVEHPRRLTELYRAARTALDENGTNTLFAAVGFLEWREAEHSDRVLRAPLLLLPVELRRKSVLEGFSLRRIDEETRLNVTLMEMLRQHFQKEIPGLEPLPEDERGVNVGQVLQLFRDAVRDLPGWEVKTDIWLGQFSFTKFLLWKDLADRLGDLTRNRVVHHLVHDAGTPFPNPPDDIRPAQLDDQFQPRDVLCPRSADSSQLAAVMAAAAGHDFVLEGPPGTGKSQTITNIIAHCLAHGKRVLFVAEKRAALDVVHRRLREEGLDPFCLELHSNKTGKAEVLAQFDQSLKFATAATPAEWESRATEMARLRTALNDYARALHRSLPCGLSAHHCLDYLLPRQTQPTVRLPAWTTILDTPAATLERARSLARLLHDRSRPLLPLADHPLGLLAREEWTPAWAERTLDRLQELKAATPEAEAADRAWREWLRCPRPTGTGIEHPQLVALAEGLAPPESVGPAFATTPWPTLSSQLDAWTRLAHERAELRAALAAYDEPRLTQLDLNALFARWQQAQGSWFPIRWFQLRSLRASLQTAQHNASVPATSAPGEVIPRGLRLRAINAAFASGASVGESCLGPSWANGEPSPDVLTRLQTWGTTLHARLVACTGDDLAWLAEVRDQLAALFGAGPGSFASGTNLGRLLIRVRETHIRFQAAWEAFATEGQLRREPIELAADFFAAVQRLTDRLPPAWPRIREWCSWQKVRREATGLGLTPLIEQLEAADAPATDTADRFEHSFRRALLHAIMERDAPLREFFGREHDERIERFRQLDDQLAGLTRGLIQARLAAGLPGDQVRDDLPKAEIGLLRRELAKKTRHLPVRRLLAGLPHLLPRLKPCVLMSPLSVAQYLESNHAPFDVVIFDEASQIPVWDAIGAIARGRQLIVVGDPKQLPPTNFFNSSGDDEAEDTLEEHKDLESILDELLTNGLRHKRLQWHYRSRHEGLIAFSNRQYYEDDLLTFPSPETALGGVRFMALPAARYDKGKSRTNPGEAAALVEELVRRLRQNSGPRRSYGVVTFSQAQQQLVEDLLDQKRREHPEIEAHFGDEPPIEGEPVIVKNLESVQGDERDVILFSICYGPDETGRVSMNFGPLNREGGERRLNVAITRAKHEVLVFSGLRSEQIDLARTRARGVRDLKSFLDYAERGPTALGAATATKSASGTSGEFHQLVGDRLRALGYVVHERVGCSDYRIDLGVLDPASPGRYLLGVECDGVSYQQAATARDRDKLRQVILEGLGWTLHRIWSTDWWHDPAAEMARLRAALDAAASAKPA
ncbi:DUF4011 domain-containing protein [Horticoccus sp. 23ND18S-11]|uniref:DUF4011 domain-containing protein n=1 Tax=Horticoccus sp. 23ND18S-11 TaxID=3391832 RepID=UPI0039C8C7F9